ncbi:GNAT family N-acetyltransferase [Paracoccus actinidiae]|uniref:GNAT family N-acetyltransferase n=1 Tax=Paracoccus actinidiae TaxID=3064531 RepID=UPI0027D2F42C|nr:GNAT family N-acetyltransferase [Paracoccus sp. M09]
MIGCCSFVGPPRDGLVETAYFTFPHAEGLGFARAMAASLISIAKSHAPFLKVFAHTLPGHNASRSVLGRLGFGQVGDAIDDEAGQVWRWELVR